MGTRTATSTWVRDAERIDVALYAAVAATPTPALDRAVRRLTTAANYSRLSLAAAAALAVARGARGRRAARMGLSSVALTSAAVNLAIKPLARRRRPDRDTGGVPLSRHVPMPVTRSFPSGHTASAFAFATAVGHVLPREALVLRMLAAAVGYSRVHAGVHFPGDVLLGALIGTSAAQITVYALEQRATR
jgi:membrane-associated phospholipid phosphatase